MARNRRFSNSNLRSKVDSKTLPKSSPGRLSITLESSFGRSQEQLSTTFPTRHGNRRPFGPIGAKAQGPEGPG